MEPAIDLTILNSIVCMLSEDEVEESFRPFRALTPLSHPVTWPVSARGLSKQLEGFPMLFEG